MRAWAEAAKQDVATVARAAILQLSRSVILNTPVGNPDLWVTKDSNGNYVDYIAYRGYPTGYIGGTARGNWQASIGTPATGTLDRPDADGSDSLADVQAQLERAVGDLYYLTNNLPYIRRLEYDGWSTQAPGGMVRIAVAEFDEAVVAAVRALR